MSYVEVENLAKGLPHEQRMRLVPVLLTETVWENQRVFLEQQKLPAVAEMPSPWDELEAAATKERLVAEGKL
jgi:non-ribosomal peptide synthetase component F